MTVPVEVRHFHVFCGVGGAALGFDRGDARAGGMVARFRCIGAVDVDASACRDFERLVGARATVLDLFSADGYRAYHGHQPPPGWREATPDDLRRAAGGERPHVVYSSPPCQGFSGLIPENRAAGARYQALNELSFRGIWLALEAWADDPPEFFVMENVPRMEQRGAHWLAQVEALLDHHGYSVAPAASRVWDLGELGGLAQRRRRLQLVARHRQKVAPMVYQPERRPLRAVGEVIGGLPLPGHPLAIAAGPMHKLPRLQWRTWVRLALVEAGKDWRSLRRLEIVDGHVVGLAIVPERYWHHGALGVQRWTEPAGTVTGGAKPMAGAFAVEDPRTGRCFPDGYGVVGWGNVGSTVTGNAMPTTGRFAVADPRHEHGACYQQMGVGLWDEPAATVTSQSRVGGGRSGIADPRPAWGGEYGQYGVVPWDQPGSTVIAKAGAGSGPHSIADPRPGCSPVAHRNKWRVMEWGGPAGTVTGATRPGSGAAVIADPRGSRRLAWRNVFRVVDWREASQAVTAGAGPTAGGQAVADPRPGLAGGGWVAGGGSGPFGVLPWSDPAPTVSASGRYDNGQGSVADPRVGEGEGGGGEAAAIPAATDRLECLIVAPDGTWHRPLTTLELAALQGLVDPGEWLELEGTSDTEWRRRIGNAVPPAAAAVVASVVGSALLASWSGTFLQAAHTEPWCLPLVAAVSVDVPGIAS